MDATTNIWDGVGQQLRCPSGHPGMLVGHVMALINRAPNRLAIEALDVRPSDTVVELGFGPGMGIRQLSRAAPHGHVMGVDQSPEMLILASRANRRAIREERVELSLGRFHALPWQDGSVNKILAVNVVYFFRRSGEEFREARRILRRNGAMAVYATDRSTMCHWKFSGPDTHALLDARSLRDLARRGGFANDEITISDVRLPFGINGLLAVLRKFTP